MPRKVVTVREEIHVYHESVRRVVSRELLNKLKPALFLNYIKYCRPIHIMNNQMAG